MPPVTTELPVDGASVTTFDRFGDSRGYFNELYNETKYDESLQKEWKQVSFSSSQKHALRGLHCSPYGKFITCVRGAFYDVIADFREDSPTFGRWCGVLLTEHNKKQVYVPANCGHGFFTIEDNTCALYLQQGCFNPVNEKDNHPRDPLFDVAWPVPSDVWRREFSTDHVFMAAIGGYVFGYTSSATEPSIATLLLLLVALLA